MLKHVIIILDTTLTLPDRRKLFSQLVGKANFRHNSKMRAQNKNDIIPKYKRVNEDLTANEITLCIHCGHVYRNKSARNHQCVEENKKYRIDGEKIGSGEKSTIKWVKTLNIGPKVRNLMESLQ